MVGIFFSVRFLHICTAVIYWCTLSLCASRSTSASPSRLSLHSYSAFMIRGNPKLGVLGLTTVRINYVHWLRWHRLHHPWALRGVHCNYASRGVLFYLSLVTATSVLCAPRSTFPAGHSRRLMEYLSAVQCTSLSSGPAGHSAFQGASDVTATSPHDVHCNYALRGVLFCLYLSGAYDFSVTGYDITGASSPHLR